MKKRFISIFLCVCFTLALFSSCKSKNKYDTIRFPISSDPLCLDPQIAVGTPANIVINNCFEFKVFQAFAIPLTISVIAAIATLIPEIPFHWYWAGYFVLLILGVKSSFTKLSSINRSNSKLFSFASELRNKPNIEGNHIDFYVVHVTKVLLLTLFVALVLSLIIFCVINWYSFGIN